MILLNNEKFYEIFLCKRAFILILMLLVCTYPMSAESASVNEQQQSRRVTGVVLDEQGTPVVGATIIEKGVPTNGAITNVDGEFSIQVTPNSVLAISFIGYKKQEINVGNNTSLRITLVEDLHSLDELVVVGYGTQKKVNVTGSVTSVDISKEAESRPITTLSASLAGLAPGLYVRSATNDPGSSASLMLRGQGTLNNSAPLVIVDGVETSMDNVAAHDVASISVLKDAASASIYGSRAANGVILITTKQGQVGKVQVNYNGYGAFQSVSNLMNLVSNSVEYMEILNEAAINSNVKPYFSEENIKLWRDNQGGDPLLWPNTDWGDALFRTAFTTNHNLAISGGTDKMRSHISFDYSDTPGIIENTGFKRYIVRANNQIQVTPWLRLGANLSGVFTDKDRGSNSLSGMFTNSVGAVPTVVVKSPDGRYGGTNNVEDNQAVASPLWYMNNYKGDNTTHKFFSNFFLNFNPFEGFNVNASYYYDIHTNKYTTLQSQNDRWNFQTNTILASGITALSVGKYEARNSKNFMDANMSYEKTFFEKLNLFVMAGASQEKFFSETMSVSKQGLIDEFLTELDAATGAATATGSRQEWAMRSFFGRINLNWAERYLLEMNIRRDGSSRFASNNRWGNFPSISVGWRLSEESFMEPFRGTWLDNLKIRASYGSLGNNSIANYVHIPVLVSTMYPLNDVPITGFYQNAIANANVSWESTYVTNIGIDFGLLNHRLTGSFEWYDKHTKDILLALPAPYAHGNATIPAINSAEVKNTGVEVTLGWQDKINDFSYYINGNFTYNKNEVTKFKGEEASISGTNMIKEGLPINIQYIRHVDRLVQTDEDLAVVQRYIDNAPAGVNPFPNGRPQLGDLLYKDINGDGIINDDDRDVTGNGPIPKFMYGITLGASYKGFDFSMLIQGLAGLQEHFRSDYHSSVLRYSIIVNKDVVDGRWYEGRTSKATYPRVQVSDSRNTVDSDFWLYDKDYLKIRNIQVGYTLPKELLSSIGVSRLRIYAGLENFFTFTDWPGLDPEVTGTNYPTMKQVVFGANLSF